MLMTTPRRLLILNGSHSDIPLIKAAKSLGFYVITTGNNPHLIGHAQADEYHCGDFSDHEAMLKMAERLKIDAVCSCANDFGAITASYISEKMGLPGHDPYEMALLLHHKDRFKTFSSTHDIPTPCAEIFGDINAALSSAKRYRFPLIVKPIDLTGGKGVSKVTSLGTYADAVALAFSLSRMHRIVVEEFIEGTQHSFSTFILKGKVVFYFSDNEYSYPNPFLVSTSAAPATNVAAVSGPLIHIAEKMALLLSLKDGVFHIQYLYNDGEPQIIEITRRCSGDLYPYPVDYSTGLDWASWIVRAETGMDCSAFPQVAQKGFCGRHCLMSTKNGTVHHVLIDESLAGNVTHQLMWGDKGWRIKNYMEEKIGIVVLKYDSMDEMLDKTNRMNELIRIEMDQ
jgi:biotin carboxylase